jgi:predicted nucleic acid-binding protein
MLVVDASVVVKIFAPEKGSDVALEIVGAEQERLAPAHAFAEVGEVLVRKGRAGELTNLQIEDILNALRRGFTTVPLDDLIGPAVQISIETGASVYDCFYVALAVAENCSLVTADDRLIAKMKGTHFAALLRPLDSSTASP